MGYHVSLSDGQAFMVELPSRESVEWFLKLDYPEATFEGGGDTLTAWETEDARRAGQKPVAVVAKVSFKCETN